MRPEFDSEIDSLLRGHARRAAAPPGALGGAPRPSRAGELASVSHLDADEIATFAEGELPAAARSRYTSHLADCDDCRRLVAQVTLAAGVADRVGEREQEVAAAVAAARSPSWRERLAAVFAPRAWRYAMPVVALLAVSAVVLVVTRRLPQEGATQTAGERAAQRQAQAPAAVDTHHAGAQPPPAGESDARAKAGNVAADAPAAGAGEDQVAKLEPKPEGSAGQATADGSFGTTTRQPETAQKTVSEVAPVSAPAYAPEPAATPMPAPPAAAAASRPTGLREGVTTQATPTPLPPPTPEEVERASASRDDAPATKRHGPQRGGRAMAELSASEQSKDERARTQRRRGPAAQQQQGIAAANRSEDEGAKARGGEAREQQQAETRAVGGRRFRREGNVWVDTAYRPGQATVVVRRDSEQYRALTADEPEIGRISRALGGEAVIVWKGRAYRVKP